MWFLGEVVVWVAPLAVPLWRDWGAPLAIPPWRDWGTPLLFTYRPVDFL